MKIETATVIRGSETPVGEGNNQAQRCILRLSNGTQRAAVLKRLPQQCVIAEAFSALLLRAWGLTVPDPFLVNGEQNEIYFASADTGYPNLKQRLHIGEQPDGLLKESLTNAAYHIVAGLAQTPLAIAADEAIDNRDRNLGNVLWDGADEAWIDHELVLGLAAHLPDQNKLTIMVDAQDNQNDIRQSSIAAWIAMNREFPNDAAVATNAPHLADMVAARLAVLGNRILGRFPAPNDLLSGA